MRECFSFLLIPLLVLSCGERHGDEHEADIDTIFAHWDRSDSPGAAVAVMKDGQIVFKKGYGMANLEYEIPITSQSIFHIASESKQYTAFCIVLLAQQEKLSLDDDIRKYLPYVPDFGKTLTIRNLIHHTSGLRDQWQLLSIGGHSIDDVIRQDHVRKLVGMQKALNFEPGSRMLYCNTGYTLLAEIVEKVSGKSFRDFAEDEIFKPLGMSSTHFHDDNTEIVKNRTYSYRQTGQGFANDPLNYATVGATSLFTTVEDEMKWLYNFETGEVGGKKAIDQMHELGILNNKRVLDYAFAVTIDTVNGYQRIGHGGADAGYRTYAARFPQEKLAVVVFANVGNFNPRDVAMKVAALYLPAIKDKRGKETPRDSDRSLYPFFSGSYTTQEGSPVHIIDSTNLYVRFGQQPFLLSPLTDYRFDLFDGYAEIVFPDPAGNPVPQLTFKTDNDEVTFVRFETLALSDSERNMYVGTYVSDELETQYHIVNTEGDMVLRHRKHPDVVVEPVTVNQFSTPHWWMSNIIFTRDVNGKIDGFEVNSDRVLHLKFQKVDL